MLKELFEKYDELEDYIIDELDKRVSMEIVTEIKDGIEKNTITEEEAKMWIEEMTPSGIRWTMEEIKEYLVNEKIEEKDFATYWLVINMYYNDIYEVAKKYEVDKFDFYFDMAKSFIEDEDAKPFKVRKYFE